MRQSYQNEPFDNITYFPMTRNDQSKMYNSYAIDFYKN